MIIETKIIYDQYGLPIDELPLSGIPLVLLHASEAA